MLFRSCSEVGVVSWGGRDSIVTREVGIQSSRQRLLRHGARASIDVRRTAGVEGRPEQRLYDAVGVAAEMSKVTVVNVVHFGSTMSVFLVPEYTSIGVCPPPWIIVGSSRNFGVG